MRAWKKKLHTGDWLLCLVRKLFFFLIPISARALRESESCERRKTVDSLRTFTWLEGAPPAAETRILYCALTCDVIIRIHFTYLLNAVSSRAQRTPLRGDILRSAVYIAAANDSSTRETFCSPPPPRTYLSSSTQRERWEAKEATQLCVPNYACVCIPIESYICLYASEGWRANRKRMTREKYTRSSSLAHDWWLMRLSPSDAKLEKSGECERDFSR